MDGGAWWAAVHGVPGSWAWLSDFTFTFHFYALEKEMATHSSILAWRIPGTEEPSGLLSMGSHRVRHDWSDLAAAAAAWSIYRLLKRIYKISPKQKLVCIELKWRSNCSLELCMLSSVPKVMPGSSGPSAAGHHGAGWGFGGLRSAQNAGFPSSGEAPWLDPTQSPGTVSVAVFSVPRLRLTEKLLNGPLPAKSRAGALRGQHDSTLCPLAWLCWWTLASHHLTEVLRLHCGSY